MILIHRRCSTGTGLLQIIYIYTNAHERTHALVWSYCLNFYYDRLLPVWWLIFRIMFNIFHSSFISFDSHFVNSDLLDFQYQWSFNSWYFGWFPSNSRGMFRAHVIVAINKQVPYNFIFNQFCIVIKLLGKFDYNHTRKSKYIFSASWKIEFVNFHRNAFREIGAKKKPRNCRAREMYK